ncbi:MAG TPA: hypothetical protein VM580_10710, partial [Labilithrix sp.]|nr:hypothetical protein [Labilithrix sp.]
MERIAAERRINVAAPLTPNTGKLIAEGTPTKPIKFTSDGEGDGGAGSGLSQDATLHRRGVPYHMGDSEGDYFTIGASDGKLVTLTIEPGVVMKFEPKTAFMVQ